MKNLIEFNDSDESDESDESEKKNILKDAKII